MKTQRILWVIGGVGLVLLLVVVAAMRLVAGRVAVHDPIRRAEDAYFPQLQGTNLKFEPIMLPDDLAGAWRLLVVAYTTDQQVFVNKWLLPLEALNTRYPQLAGYYVPILPADTASAALPILGGMTLAAKNDQDRARTVVVFTDVDGFNGLVGVPDTSQVQLFLLDTAGLIHWRGTGQYTPTLLADLESVLANLATSS